MSMICRSRRVKTFGFMPIVRQRSLSVGAKRDQWIDSGGVAGWHQARERRDQTEEGGDGDERARIEGRHAKQHALKHAGGRRRTDETDGNAEASQHESTAENQPEDLPAPGPKG